MSSGATPSQIEEQIRGAVRHRIAEIVEEERQKAVAAIERRIQAEADSLALQLMSHYTVYEQAQRIIIEVKKL